MKNIVLTFDYELFFGKNSGSVQKCMIEPMDLLIDLFEKYSCKMTVFWDVLHYIRAKELEVLEEVKAIESSIEKLSLKGHDIQLHIHSHWIDAKYQDGGWIFPNYKHYKLQSLSKDEISNIVDTSVKTIEELTGNKVTSFRAGGWQIEPFEKIKEALIKNSIFIDSSVTSDKFQNSGLASFDFRDYPKSSIYRFEDSPKIEKKDGRFIEYQIKSVKIPNYIMLRSYLNKMFFKEKYPKLGDGVGVGGIAQTKVDVLKILCKRVVFGSLDMLSLEFTSKMIFEFMLKNVEENSIMIGHPKSIGYKHIEVIEDILKQGSIKFVSLKDIR